MTGDTLELVGALDFDAGTRQHDLQITVNDGTNIIVVSGSVTVNPINEASPIYTASEDLTKYYVLLCSPCLRFYIPLHQIL